MGKHRLRTQSDDDDREPISGTITEDDRRTFERDSGGVQGFEYFGVDTREQEEDK